MAEKVRIGIVGANVSYGWGTRAHLPALAALPEFEVAAVCTNHEETAEETASKFGIGKTYTHIDQIVADPDLDLIVVSVKVPQHYELVMPAIQAGKNVFCEWPLGRTLEQAIEMRDAAHAAGVVHAIGLQSRGAPALNQAHDMVEDGRLGEIVSVTMRTSGGGAGVRPSAWQADITNGVTTLTIQGGHALDAMRYVVGDFREVSSVVTTQIKQAKLAGTDEVIVNTSPDNIAIAGILQNGAVASVHIESVPALGTGFQLEVQGTEGTLVIRADAGVNTSDSTLLYAKKGDSSLQPLPVDEHYTWAPEVPKGAPKNVGEQYRRLGEAVKSGQSPEPNFDTAVSLHRVIDAIVKASETGQRQHL